MSGFIGMRGTGDWATNQRPENWREMILRLYPNGKAPLTAILSMMKTEPTNDPTFHWWTKTLELQSGTVTGRYTDASLSVSYTSGGTSGDFIYFKMSAADVTQVRIGHTVLLKDASDPTMDCVGLVVDRDSNGASSYIKVKLLEDDDNSTSYDLSDCDTFVVIGNANAEGAARPDALSYDPVEWSNYTQIFRDPLDITGTAMETKLRTNPQAYQELKRETLEYHSIAMERAFMFGVPSAGTGDNGKPLRTTLGLIPAIRGGYTGHGGTAGTESCFSTDSDYSGQSWLQGGEDWLLTQLETLFKYGNTTKTALCGSSALISLNKLVSNGGDFTFSPKTVQYGIRVMEWVTPVGTINLLTHPLMSQETTLTKNMVIFEPENIKYRPLQNRDTKFISDDPKKGNWTYKDGVSEEYLTECGLEYHFPVGWGYLTNLGVDSTV